MLVQVQTDGCLQTYSAYSTTPLLPSWLGSGTSTLLFFIGGGAPGPPVTFPAPYARTGTASLAGFLVDEEMKAALATFATRNGVSALDGAAPRSANAVRAKDMAEV